MNQSLAPVCVLALLVGACARTKREEPPLNIVVSAPLADDGARGGPPVVVGESRPQDRSGNKKSPGPAAPPSVLEAEPQPQPTGEVLGDLREVEGGVEGGAVAEGEVAPEAEGDKDNTISATIRRRMPGLEACYEVALQTNPELGGKHTYTVTIDIEGSVSDVLVEQDSVEDPGVRECCVEKIRGWRFELEDATEPAEVTFSVQFTG